MTGSATLTGRSSSAVGTTHDASKVTPCIVISLLAAKPPSPEVVHDKAPVPPGRVFLYDHIDPSWPRMFRIASCCQLPASRPAPSVHPRKRAGRGKNPFLFAMLFEKNIEIFSDPNPSVLCVFSICLPPFRGWTGVGREAGSWQGDAIRNVTGSAGIGGQTGIAYPLAMDGNTGALCPQGEKGTHSLSTMTSVNTYGGLVFDASHAVPTAAENRPVNIAVPVILYLGLSA